VEFNEDKVRKITSEIIAALARLEDLQKLSLEAFMADAHKIGSAKYSLIVAIEGAVDLCNHIIAKNGFRTSEDYADTFKVMNERGAFNQELRILLFKWQDFATDWSIFIGTLTIKSSFGSFRRDWEILNVSSKNMVFL